MPKEILKKLYDEAGFKTSDIKTPILVASLDLLFFHLTLKLSEELAELLRALYEVPKIIVARRPILISEALALAKKQNPTDEVASYRYVLECLSTETHQLVNHNYLNAPENSSAVAAKAEMTEFLSLLFSVLPGTLRYICELEQIPNEGQSGINKNSLIANDLEEHILNLVKILRKL